MYILSGTTEFEMAVLSIFFSPGYKQL